jgi:C-terminal processing protease CtpA/Prc
MKKLLTLALVMFAAGCGNKPGATSTPTQQAKEVQPLSAPQKKAWHDYPKVSPFEAVRWRDAVPEVRVKGVWYELRALDVLTAGRIVEACKTADKKNWQKRFEEDLVEILVRMGHEPGKTATLEVRRLDSQKSEILKDVPLTEENRKSIWKARNQKTALEPGRVRRPHADRVAEGFPYLLKRVAAADLSRQQAEEDLDQLEYDLESYYAYLRRKGVDYRAALDAVRNGLGEGISRADLTIQLAKVLALFGDGHSGVSGLERALPAEYAPFLVGDAEGQLVAFRPDRTGFLDPDYPFLRKLDGIEVERWLEAARRIVPAGSSQLVRHMSIRHLRYVGYLRRELGLPGKPVLRLELDSRASQKPRTLEVALTKEKPIYGDWPRKAHSLLSGNIGYLRIPTMDDDPRFLQGLVEAMGRFRKTRGLVIDVRGNGGGSRAALTTLFPFFMEPADSLRVVNVAAYRLEPGEKPDAPEGYLADRSLYPLTSQVWSRVEKSDLERFAAAFQPEWQLPKGQFSAWHYFVVKPQRGKGYYHYDAPVVVLMNADCFSATDIFLGAFKGWRKVTLMGTASGGGSGRVRRTTLQNSGLVVHLSSMASFRADGKLYEGRGILPDEQVPTAATDLIGATDSVLEAALRRLQGS